MTQAQASYVAGSPVTQASVFQLGHYPQSFYVRDCSGRVAPSFALCGSLNLLVVGLGA